MVYRQPADQIAKREEEAVDGPLLRLDMRGRSGADGADGNDGAAGVRRGEDGDAGEDAGPAARGEDGGTIAILVASAGADSASVTGETDAYRFGRKAVAEQVDFRRRGEIELVVRGGKGGTGGSGGRGGNGARGRDGSDATRYSSGGDGGRGGDGGEGGDGTSGGDGGDGGKVVVRVAEADTHLLMLVAEDVRGGKGGEAGRNGGGGAGGPGGRGGSSYSWTETSSYTDGNGNTQTRSTSHSSSGGSDGRPGRDGRDSRAEIGDGRRGAAGTFTIEVGDAANAITRYERRYDVALRSFQHRNENDDGIYEPEEKVFVHQVEVENTGGMPLPSGHDIVVRVLDDGWIAPNSETKLVLPHGLAAGARHVFAKEELELSLRIFRPQKSGEPLAAPETIRLFAALPDVHRSFAGFEGPTAKDHGSIVIRFPVEVSKPETLYSLAPGQAARIRWSIANVADKDFGTLGEVKRAVAVKVLLGGGELGAHGIRFFDDTGACISLDEGFVREVPAIGAKSAVSFEATIAIAEAAAPYTSARIVVSAELGHIDDPSRVRAVQLQEITVRVGKPFDARGSDVLLVVNNRTTAEEVAAWERLIAALGLSCSLWDASLEAGVDVLRRAAIGEQSYRLVVVLNNTMDTGAGEKRASALVDKATSLALADRSIHVVYAGKAPTLESLLVPTYEAAPADDALAEIGNAEIVSGAIGDRIGGSSRSIPIRVTYVWPWTEPQAHHLEHRAHALHELLERAFPERRYVVVHRFDPQRESATFPRKFILGTIEVRRTLDVTRGAITSIEIEPTELHAPSFVDDDATLAIVASALPFTDKLRLLDGDLSFGMRRPKLDDGCPDVIVGAVLESLLREQATLAQHGWRRGAGKKDLWRAMPMLDELAQHGFAAGPLDGNRALRFVELVAWLDLVARDHDRFWEWIPPFVFLRRGPTLRRAVREKLDALISRIHPDPKAAWRAIDERREEIERGCKARKKAREVDRALAFANDRLGAHVATRKIVLDDIVAPSVLDAAAYQEIEKKDAGRRERARKITDGASDARRAFLLTERCADLLMRSGADPATAEDEIAIAPPPPVRVATDADALDVLADLREDGGAFAERSEQD